MDFFKQHFQAETLLEGQVFPIDKPLGWTSFHVVNKIRWFLKNETGLKKLKVGHAGTLDPLATGLLIICTGKKTKSIDAFQKEEKTYEGTFKLGATTPSYDLETEINAVFSTKHINENLIQEAALAFTGSIEQYPPLYSALKKDGKRLYEFAREGKSVDLKARIVQISKFEVQKIALPDIDFLVQCSKGTYIRSLANDFGRKLESGAYLSALKRTQSGNFTLSNAYTMKSVVDIDSNKNIKRVELTS